MGGPLVPALEQGAPDVVWLTLAVLGGQLPTEAEVERCCRQVRLDGAAAVLSRLVRVAAPVVEVVTGRIVVDVHATAGGSAQTVAYRLADAWQRDHDPIFIGWDADRAAIQQVDLRSGDRAAGLLVPWRCHYVLPETVGGHRHASALSSLLRYSGTSGGIVGAGCGPLVAAEGEPASVREAFATGLGAVVHAGRIAATSPAAAQEYAGWRAMLGGAGLEGPDVRVVDLGDPAALLLDPASGPPTVLVTVPVTAALQAALDRLRQEGLEITVVSASGPLATPRVTVHAPTYDPLGDAVARSLLAGVPVITTRFGASGDVAGTDGGALLVDPRSEAELTQALRRVLTDDVLHSRLVAQALSRQQRPWEVYAEQVWAYLVTDA